jgi:hypothetical protein
VTTGTYVEVIEAVQRDGRPAVATKRTPLSGPDTEQGYGLRR